jgi:hypothetical protein
VPPHASHVRTTPWQDGQVTGSGAAGAGIHTGPDPCVMNSDAAPGNIGPGSSSGSAGHRTMMCLSVA